MDGTPFGRYRLLELLGRGGMGAVWRAYDTETNNRVVAIKLLQPHLAEDPVFVQRFRREADAAAQLNNPHVIPIHNYGEIDGRLYADMRLVEGRDLGQVLADGPLEPGRAVRIIEHVANAAHKIGLVHRDVKPSNILLDEDDFAYLIDFGIALGADEVRLTGTDTVIGSLPYMAPERFRAHQADARADIYALTCVLYECLTGSRPFPGDSAESQVAGHLTDPPPQLSTMRPNMPAEFDAVIAKGMAKDPDQRYATTEELASDARDAVTAPEPAVIGAPAPHPDDATRPIPDDEVTAGLQPPARAASARWWRRKAIVIPAAVLIAAIIATVAVATRDRDSSHPPSPSTAKPALPPSFGAQTVLPFADLASPDGVAVDAAGSVYVADADYIGRVVKSSAPEGQTTLPFTGLGVPKGVDAAGSVYVVDQGNSRVVRLPGGSAPQEVLPFTGLATPWAITVDDAGNVYVTDITNLWVVKLRAG